MMVVNDDPAWVRQTWSGLLSDNPRRYYAYEMSAISTSINGEYVFSTIYDGTLEEFNLDFLSIARAI